jgi:hypothetical protein
MSRNKNVDYSKYVHPFTDAQGKTRWAVAEEKDGELRWQRPRTTYNQKMLQEGEIGRAHV